VNFPPAQPPLGTDDPPSPPEWPGWVRAGGTAIPRREFLLAGKRPSILRRHTEAILDRMERIPLEPVDGVHVTTLVDNSSDVLMPDEGLVRRWGLVGTAGQLPVISSELAEGGKTVDFLRAEHGFSALIEVHDGDRRRRVLFDAGITPDGLIGNLDRLTISPDTFEAVVLSHGHFDHVMGLDGLARRLGPRNLPLLLHPDFWTRRRVVSPGGGAWELPVPSRAGIEDVGFAIIENRQPSYLLDGVLLVTGEVERTTTFETGMPTHEAFRDGDWQPDPLIHDDQAVVLNVRDKGLVVLTGCGHSGIVNIVRHTKALTGIEDVYAVLGGLHLSGRAFETIIPQTVTALAAENLDVLVPAHCTGWKAQHAFAAALPNAFRPNSVGSRFEL
jgi:7,8-dihydropterin-6-yl-methyl-4-(beta-D-ribofuranosyl)aminobenzene 5'-phosphate synthase